MTEKILGIQELDLIMQSARCLYTHTEVEIALSKFVRDIESSLYEKQPIILASAIGGFVTLGQLLPRLSLHLEVDYIHATRYRKSEQGGEIIWKAFPSISLKDRTVLILDDILDEGITLQHIINYCQEQGAMEILSAVLINKTKERSEKGLKEADFSALTVPDDCFVFGYGMDYKGFFRNLPAIYTI